ncbi:hypothetical protein CMU93_08970 [Elizabethkingia anophelis]|nr:hypothetical protein [Elizabethkingia anophelis]
MRKHLYFKISQNKEINNNKNTKNKHIFTKYDYNNSLLMKKIFPLLILFLFTNVFSQNKKEKEIDNLFNSMNNSIPSYANGDTEENLKICTEVYYKSKEVGYTVGQIKALLYMAEAYSIYTDVKPALEKIDEGLTLTEGKDEYALAQAAFLLLKGKALSNLGYFEEARKDIQEAVNLTRKAKNNETDIVHNIKAFADYFIVMFFKNDTQHTISNKDQEMYLLSAYKEATQISNQYYRKKFVVSVILEGLISFYTELDQLDKVNEYIKQGDHINKNEKSQWQIVRNAYLGTVAKKKKNYQEAITYYQIALKTSKEYKFLSTTPHLYAALAECYHIIKNYEQESLYLYKYKRFNDSLVIAEKNLVSDVLSKEKIKNESTNMPFFSSSKVYYIFGVALLLSVAGYYIVKRKTSAKRSPEITDEMDDEQINIYEQIPNLPSDIDHEKLSQAIKMAQKDDPAFYFKFMEVFPNFHQNLLKVSRKLSQSDLEFCAMMKLNFDTKGIAAIKRISAGAVESKKHRIRKKLGLETDDNIYIWLIEK